ncbi:MAG: hypothetical protein A2096_10325 [Spirochaetes bacterium GWF1_41_5]|nr:MAG: hypothetical protein A2096_10325 [Spirochaetes bacterium GWF1_41_5]
MNKLKTLLTISAVLIFSSCFRTFFLNLRLDHDDKAQILAIKGIKLYEQVIVKEKKFEESLKVRRYFEHSLDFNPGYKTALLYIAHIDNFRSTMINQSLATAKKYKRKIDDAAAKKQQPDTSDEEEMLTAVDKTLKLDSGNAEALILHKETAETRIRVCTKLLSRAQEVKKKFETSANTALKDKAAAEARDLYYRILLFDPKNKQAGNEISGIASYIKERIKILETEAAKYINDGKTAKAEEIISSLKVLTDTDNDRLLFRRMSYDLYYNAARQKNSARDYQAALRYAEKAAQYALDTRKISDLQNNIQVSIRQKQLTADYAKTLTRLDAMISAEKWESAQELVNDMLSGVKTPEKKNELLSRKKSIDTGLVGLIETLYESGVRAFNDEDFKKSIGLFNRVQRINGSYKDTADYLSRARQKQELLESFD